MSWATWLLFIGLHARRVVLCVRCPRPLGSCSLCARSACCVACAVSWATWPLFTGVSSPCIVRRVQCPGRLSSCSPVCSVGALCCVCGVLGHLAPVHWCSRSARCVACAVSWATWLLFTLCTLGVLCCVCGVLGHLAPVHHCERSVRCVSCAVSWATWLLFTYVHARCVVLRVRCPGPLGSCLPGCLLGALCCVCVVLGHLAPVHRCALSVCFVPCAVSWATWLLFTDVSARCAVLRVWCLGPLGSCSPVCSLRALCCVCDVLGHSAPVHRCSRSACCVACAVSCATWLLFISVLARVVVLRVRCPWPRGSCSSVFTLGSLCCVCVVLGHLAPVHRCVPSVHCVACALSWATRLLCTGVQVRHVRLHVPCPGPLGICSPCARSVCCVACVVSWATWLLSTGVPAQCVVLRVRCPGPLGCYSPVCSLGALRCVCGVLGHLAPVHPCASSVRCVPCVVSWATWFLFADVLARCVVLRVRCPGPLSSCSPVCTLGALRCVCGVLDHLAPVHRCACRECCAVCAVSWATWLLFTGVHARCVVLRVRCLGPLGSCSTVCFLGALRCVCGVLGHSATVHRSSRSACCVVCAVSLAAWLLLTLCTLRVLCCVCGVLGHLAPVYRCELSVRCALCAVSWAT